MRDLEREAYRQKLLDAFRREKEARGLTREEFMKNLAIVDRLAVDQFDEEDWRIVKDFADEIWKTS